MLLAALFIYLDNKMDKKYALKCKQSPLQKAMTFGENALRVMGTVKGLYDSGKQIYEIRQSVAPVVSSAASFLI